MAHECINCGQECYCDMEDTGGWKQPINCRHLRFKEECDGHPDWPNEYWDGDDEPMEFPAVAAPAETIGGE